MIRGREGGLPSSGEDAASILLALLACHLFVYCGWRGRDAVLGQLKRGVVGRSCVKLISGIFWCPTDFVGGRHNMASPPAGWPFDLESGARVTCDMGYLCANLSLPRPLCSWLRPDVRNRQTDVRRTSSLNAPYPRGGGIKTPLVNALKYISYSKPRLQVASRKASSQDHSYALVKSHYSHIQALVNKGLHDTKWRFALILPFCVVLLCVFCLLVVLVRLSIPVQVIEWNDSSPKWPTCWWGR